LWPLEYLRFILIFNLFPMDLQAAKMKKEKKEKPSGGGDTRKGK